MNTQDVFCHTEHYNTAIQELKSDNQLLQFVCILLKDTVFFLDEIPVLLKRIKENQEAVKDLSSDEESQSLLEQLASDESDLTLVFTSVDTAVEVLSYYTEHDPDNLLKPELVSRLAEMLSLNVQLLCGQKSCKGTLVHFIR